MKVSKSRVITCLLLIILGLLLFGLRSNTWKKAAVVETKEQAKNAPKPAVVKGKSSQQDETPIVPPPIYLTQVQQDSRQHLVGRENYPEVEKARQYGADAKVTLRVIDSKGVPVPQAQVEVAFFPQDSYEAAEITKGLTDSKGQFSVSGKTVDDISLTSSKDGYYVTNRKFHFYWRGTECVKDGRWQPWNTTLEVVLKELRNPIPLFTKYSELFLPQKNKAIGFDCLVGDLIEPYGQGKETDLLFIYSSDLSGEAEFKYTNQLVIAASTVSGGIQKLVMDNWSEFRSVHFAPDGGYRSEIVFSCKSVSPMARKEVKFTTDIYLIFQSRVQLEKDGRVISANYGKIYPMNFDYGEAPPDKGQGRVEFGYYFNSTPNDRNLEFDGKTNLFNPGWRENWPRNP